MFQITLFMIFILFHCCLLLSTGIFLHKKFAFQPLGSIFIWGLLLKCLVGLLGFEVMQRYGGGLHDSNSAFNIGSILVGKLLENPLKFAIFFFEQEFYYNFDDYRNLYQDWTLQALFMYKITTFFCLFTQSNFYLVNLWFSFLSYLGLWLCANIIAKKVRGTSWAAALAFLFFPSVLVWSSGLLKESLMWLFCGSLIAIMLNWQQKTSKILPTVMLFVFGFLLFKLKFYYFAVLFAAGFAYFAGMKMYSLTYFRSNQIRTFAFLGSIFLLGMLFVSFFRKNLALDYFFEGLVLHYQGLANNSDVDNIIHFRFSEPYWLSVCLQSPKALFTAFFSPLFWQSEGNLLKMAAGLENTLLAFLFLLTFLLVCWQQINKIMNKSTKTYTQKTQQIDKNSKNKLQENELQKIELQLLFFCLVLYVVVLAILITLATPNLGTLIRYKVGFLPFFVYILLAKCSFVWKEINKN